MRMGYVKILLLAATTCLGCDRFKGAECFAQDHCATNCDVNYDCVDGVCQYASINWVWLDRDSELCWNLESIDVDTGVHTWKQARDICLNQYGSHLPTMDELISLVEGCDVKQCDPPDACGNCPGGSGPSETGCYWKLDLQTDCYDHYFWSSSTNTDTTKAWAMDFSTGTSKPVDKDSQLYAMCARRHQKP